MITLRIDLMPRAYVRPSLNSTNKPLKSWPYGLQLFDETEYSYISGKARMIDYIAKTVKERKLLNEDFMVMGLDEQPFNLIQWLHKHLTGCFDGIVYSDTEEKAAKRIAWREAHPNHLQPIPQELQPIIEMEPCEQEIVFEYLAKKRGKVKQAVDE